MSELDWPDLLGGEVPVEEWSEQLWRSVNPSWYDGGQMTTQVFTPTKKDEGKLSSARSSAVTAEDHFIEYTQSFGLPSEGVWAVTVEEVASTDLRAVDDSGSDDRPGSCPTGHTYIDMRPFGASRRKKAAAVLRDSANARGRVFPRS